MKSNSIRTLVDVVQEEYVIWVTDGSIRQWIVDHMGHIWGQTVHRPMVTYRLIIAWIKWIMAHMGKFDFVLSCSFGLDRFNFQHTRLNLLSFF